MRAVSRALLALFLGVVVLAACAGSHNKSKGTDSGIVGDSGTIRTGRSDEAGETPGSTDGSVGTDGTDDNTIDSSLIEDSGADTGEDEAAVDQVDGDVIDAALTDSSCLFSYYPPDDAGLPSGPTPRIRTGTVDVRGFLSKEVIHRIVLRNINQIRYCYQRALYQTPDLEGRIAVKFLIAPTGDVQSAGVASSDLDNEDVEECIVTAVRCWTFPPPENEGIVVVTYPFVLQTVD